MKRLLVLIIIVAAAGPTGGCSVAMALEAAGAPESSMLAVGSIRDEIEDEIGQPVDETAGPAAMQQVTYEYASHDESAVVRAFAHGLLDFLTFGLWEFAGVTIEKEARETRARRVVVLYDGAGTVLALGGPSAIHEEGVKLAAAERGSPGEAETGEPADRTLILTGVEP